MVAQHQGVEEGSHRRGAGEAVAPAPLLSVFGPGAADGAALCGHRFLLPGPFIWECLQPARPLGMGYSLSARRTARRDLTASCPGRKEALSPVNHSCY